MTRLLEDIRKGRCAVAIGLLLAFSASASAQELVGKGEWQSLSGPAIRGTWSATLVRKGNHVQGTLGLTGSNVFAGGDVAGDIDAFSMMLGVMLDGTRQATFGGKLDGELIKGEWESDAVNDHGVWYGTLTARKTDRPAGQ